MRMATSIWRRRCATMAGALLSWVTRKVVAALRSDMREAHGLHKGLAELVNDPKAYNARLMDIAAALEWANSSCKAPFVALLGHSMGARTVEVEAGTKNNFGVKGLDRFDAYVALSPDGPGADVSGKCMERNPQADADADGHARRLSRRRLENANDSVRLACRRGASGWV